MWATKQKTNLMEVFAATSTIATKVNVREKAPEQMPICLGSVLCNELQYQYKQEKLKFDFLTSAEIPNVM